MAEVVIVGMDFLERILGFIVIWYDVRAINLENPFHLIYD